MKVTTISDLPDLELLTEVRLSRTYFCLTDEQPAGMVTAFASDRSHEENARRSRKLGADLRKAGFGFLWIDGAWIDHPGTETESRREETWIFAIAETDAEERLFGTLQTATRQAGGRRFAFKPAGARSQISIHDTNGQIVASLNGVRLDDMADILAGTQAHADHRRRLRFKAERLSPGFAGRLAGLSDRGQRSV